MMETSMLRTPTSRAGAAALAAAVVMLFSPGSAKADKLVIFKNGKALLVKSVEQDGKWVKCSFGGDDSMSVPAASIAEVTEAEIGQNTRGDDAPNQLAQGETRSYSGRGDVQDDNPALRAARALNRGNDGDDVQPEEDAPNARRGIGARSTARTLARPGQQQQQQNNSVIQGLRPLGTNTQVQNGRTGLIQRRGRFNNTDQAAQSEQDQQQQDDN
jgi:hypothetical protein